MDNKYSGTNKQFTVELANVSGNAQIGDHKAAIIVIENDDGSIRKSTLNDLINILFQIYIMILIHSGFICIAIYRIFNFS